MQYKNMIDGLQIFAKYDKRGFDAFLSAEHDVIFGPGAQIDYDAEQLIDQYGTERSVDSLIPLEEQKKLHELGWYIGEFGSWEAYC
jgi:hypothetical protein